MEDFLSVVICIGVSIIICYPKIQLQAEEMKMFPVDFQWVYLVTDTNSKDMDVTPFIQRAK